MRLRGAYVDIYYKIPICLFVITSQSAIIDVYVLVSVGIQLNVLCS